MKRGYSLILALGMATTAMCDVDPADLPEREGPKPTTSEAPAGTMIAHQQLSDTAPRGWQDWLFEKVSALPGVVTGRSLISVEGARAFHLPPELEGVNANGFIVQREFAHLHPPSDGSLHVMLPEQTMQHAIAKGWGEPHPRNPRVAMIFGPRNEKEAEVVLAIVTASYHHALGSAEVGR